MEITGKISAILEKRSGTSSSDKKWESQTFVIEIPQQDGRYVAHMAIDILGSDRIAQAQLALGKEVKVSCDIDAHEYQGKWYNSIRAWKVEAISQQYQQPMYQQPQRGYQQQPPQQYPQQGGYPPQQYYAPQQQPPFPNNEGAPF
jgi:hypothetical protein